MTTINTKIIGKSKPAVELKKMINLVASSSSPVIINGPTGSGKELVAEAIHEESRRKGNFVALNCAAIPSELMEAEIFGFEKGAFTGALKTTTGKFEQANKGTLFLDEIGDMPFGLQTKLLRVLENSTISRVGSNKEIKLDVRIICATHKNLNSLVEENIFREDLLFRLNVFPIAVPSLKNRSDDIWIEPELDKDAQSKGYVTVDPTSVLITHVGQILTNSASELLGQDEVQALLDDLELSQPNLVQTVVPKIIPLHQLTKILQNLLKEAVPISDLHVVISELAAINTQKMSNDDISEAIRPKLVPLLIQRLTKFKETLPLLTLAPDLEQLILTSVRQNPDEKMLLLDGSLAKNILSNVNEASETLSRDNKAVFLIVAPQIRRHVANFIRSQLPSVNVLSFTELPENRSVEIAYTIGGESEQEE